MGKEKSLGKAIALRESAMGRSGIPFSEECNPYGKGSRSSQERPCSLRPREDYWLFFPCQCVCFWAPKKLGMETVCSLRPLSQDPQEEPAREVLHQKGPGGERNPKGERGESRLLRNRM